MQLLKALLVAVLVFWVGAQRTLSGQLQSRPAISLAHRCVGWANDRPGVISEILRAASITDDRAAKAALAGIEKMVRPVALAAPRDVDAQYHLAALLGARADRESGRAKLGAARDSHTVAQRVLELAPGHPGASFLLARIYAGGKRLDRLTRLLATHLLGAGALNGASWAEIQVLFEKAESADPCQPEHHFELARLYHEQKMPDRADRELLHVLELTERRDGRWTLIRNTAESLARSWKEE